jgi:hypothetical protein
VVTASLAEGEPQTFLAVIKGKQATVQKLTLPDGEHFGHSAAGLFLLHQKYFTF